MPNKIASSFFKFLSRKKSKKIKFPLENIKRIAIRPSEKEGEIFYSLPLVEALSKKFKLTVLLPDVKYSKYFRTLRATVVPYRKKAGLIAIFRLRNKITHPCDLFIDLNKEDIEVFSYVLKRPVVASIYETPGVNITVRSKTNSIVNSYKSLIELIAFTSLTWETKAIKLKKTYKIKENEEVIGISSDIPTSYHGLKTVKEIEDLFKITKLISKKNDLSAIAFLLQIPQVLLLEEKEPFQPPEAIKVVRYSRKITPEIIGDCLLL
jgi:hypothetical protein